MVCNVYNHNSNAKKIEKWNIFDNWVFDKEVKELSHKCHKLSKDEFTEKLHKLLFYYFYSKCEYEVIISPWGGYADDIKVDAYNQVMLNWNNFTNYVWNYKEKINE